MLLKFLGKPSLNNALRKFNSGMPFLRSEILIEIGWEIANFIGMEELVASLARS